MANIVARSLEGFPEHAELIGDMLLGYGELESIMVSLVALATSTDENTAVRILYRMRGAQNRLDVADAILRPYYIKLGLIGPYGQWIGAMRRCKLLRNQYAHCAFLDRHNALYIADFDTAAQSTDGTANLHFARLGLDLVREQQDYFWYTEQITYYLLRETRHRKDRRRKNPDKLPKSRPVPKLDSRPS